MLYYYFKADSIAVLDTIICCDYARTGSYNIGMYCIIVASEDSGEPAHLRRLAWVYVGRSHTLWNEVNDDPDKTHRVTKQYLLQYVLFS